MEKESYVKFRFYLKNGIGSLILEVSYSSYGFECEGFVLIIAVDFGVILAMFSGLFSVFLSGQSMLSKTNLWIF